MEEQVVTLEVARLLKEKGFVNGSQAFYNANNGVFYVQTSVYINGLDEEFIEAPTQALAQKWLRDTQRTIVLVDYDSTDVIYWCNITYRNIGEAFTTSLSCGTYEEALEEGLKQALKLI